MPDTRTLHRIRASVAMVTINAIDEAQGGVRSAGRLNTRLPRLRYTRYGWFRVFYPMSGTGDVMLLGPRLTAREAWRLGEPD